MTADTLLPPTLLAALFSYSLANSITPGPNNIMLMASGVNFGIRRTVPHMVGVALGCVIAQAAAGLGLALVFSTFPLARGALEAAGIAYTLWLAWKIASSGSLGLGGPDRPHPMPFWGALTFQAVNAKLWLGAISIAALFIRPGHVAADVPLVTFATFLVNIPCMLAWTGFGAGLRDLLQKPRPIRVFNIAMGLLLAASALALLRG